MLSQAENEKLTRVGPGTPGGELLRRYWHPVYPEVLLKKNPVAAVRILGEDLVLYRDRSGDLGLIAQRCPHRMVSFALGIPEEHGLRCLYHGWLFNGEGRCVEQPLEPPESTFKDRVRIAGYPVGALGGLIWAYLGPLPAPLLPQWDLLVKPGLFRQIVAHRLPCNWLQVMENRGDLAHGTYLHGRFAQYALERQGRLTDDPKARYNATMELQAAALERGDYRVYKPIYNRFGFTKGHRMASASEESRTWTIGSNPVIFPYMLGSGPGSTGIRNSYQWGVPVDDTTTWHMQYLCYDFPEEVGPPSQDGVPYVEVPLQDERGEYTIDYVMGQDMAAWHQQGEICDRTGEHLATTDVCVIAYRKMLADQIDIVTAESSGAYIGFIAGVLGANPRRADALIVKMLTIAPADHWVLVRAIAYSGLPNWKVLLLKYVDRMPTRRAMIEKYVGGKLPTLDQISYQNAKPGMIDRIKTSLRIGGEHEKAVVLDPSPELIDVLWGYYLATGSYRPIGHMIKLLPLANDKDDVDNLTTGSAAKFTLASNAVRDLHLLAMLKRAVKGQPEDVARVLNDVIETAENVDTVRMRKESIAAIDELKQKGPNARRELTGWGQVGQGALAMGCVVAAATGQIELGIPCVVGGAAYSAGLQYISH